MERLKERLAIARRALQTLEEVLAIARPSRIERDAAIQRFEYTFEACWRAAQRYLAVAEGLSVGSPKACVRALREVGLLSDEQAVIGLEMVDDRNLTVHTYNDTVAERIHRNLRRYADLFVHWLTVMQARIKL
ncbi:MAG: nucleotidyltransferase substrate binding protein [Candidatus Rokubacteria bacterium]|nr:nucleotidyltransferase substrate binding protein [Candidatus Rokubacteria bacterium]